MDIEALKESVFGTVMTREDRAYATARADLLWNGRKPPRFPQVIVKAASVGDVQATVRFAAANGVRISVRGGGHNWSGIALQEAIVLDLSALDVIRFDAEECIAEVGPAVRNGDAARAFAARGLAFPLGHCASVPLSGYLLGGGFGWNVGAWGIACFSVESIEVVTADGELRRASAHQNPEVFWAARGAGPELFGVVTGYRLRLRPLPRAITSSVWTYRLADAAAVQRWMHEAMAVAPRNVEFTAVFSAAPPSLAGRVDKVASAIATVFADSEAEAHATLARIAAAAPAGALEIQANMPTPFEVLYAIIAQFFPEEHRYAVDSFWAAPDAGDFLARLARETDEAPSARSFSLGVVLPPPLGPLPDAAFSMIGPAFGCAYAIWQEPAEDDANVGWIRRTADALAPATVGAYLGEADLDRAGKLHRCFSTPAWNRLKALQAKYDPAGLFRTTQSRAASLESAA